MVSFTIKKYKSGFFFILNLQFNGTYAMMTMIQYLFEVVPAISKTHQGLLAS